LNTQVRIQRKSDGAPLLTTSLDDFWSGVPAPFTFDPKVVYDPYEARFVAVALSNPRSANSRVLVGVSTGEDPLGTWFQWAFDADPGDQRWADYPSLGFNSKWVTISWNAFRVADDAYRRAELLALNKADLYTGAADPGATLFNMGPDSFTPVPAVTQAAANKPQFVVESYWGDVGGSLGELRMSKLTGPVDAPALAQSFASIHGPAWTSAVAGDFAPQKGTSRRIDAGDDRIQNCVFRSGSIWCVHTVYAPSGSPTHIAAQWWELSQTGKVIQRGRIEDDDGQLPERDFAYPSIAVNADGDALIGFSRFSPGTYAGAGYAYRDAEDPKGTFRRDRLLKSGEASYVKTFGGALNRWGDYSATMVDPTDDHTMWTIQEYAEKRAGGWDRWGTWWAQVEPPAIADLSVSVTADKAAATTGSTITYSFDVKNGGPDTARRVGVTAVLPAQLRLKSTGGARCSGRSSITCELDVISANGDAGFQITADATVAGAATLHATVASTARDLDPVDDRDRITVDITGPPLCAVSGGSGRDHLKGTPGNDVLCGLGGKDVMEGRGGNDALIGGAGFDLSSYRASPAGIKGDLLAGSVTGGAGRDLLRGIEGLMGSRGDDRLMGDQGDNQFYGASGDDAIVGRGGVDSIVYKLAGRSVFVDLVLGQAVGEGRDSLSGVEEVIATDFADRLSGGVRSEAFHGRAGADVLIGRGGNDVLDGGKGGDLLYGGPGVDRCRQGSGNGFKKGCEL
jgi:uncharacterized repeat protein (TIGR01451 family)